MVLPYVIAAAGVLGAYHASQNEALRFLALVIALAWVYDGVVNEDDDFGPGDLLLVVGLAYVTRALMRGDTPTLSEVRG